MTPVWRVSLHPRDKNMHSGFAFYVEGTRKEAEASAKLRAGSAYTFTMKQASATKPHTPKRNHGRP